MNSERIKIGVRSPRPTRDGGGNSESHAQEIRWKLLRQLDIDVFKHHAETLCSRGRRILMRNLNFYT